MSTNYIYLLQEKEFIKSNIYKIEISQYPENSIILFQIDCNNISEEQIIKQIIKQFIENFIQRTDIGDEYFEGDYKKMIDMINIIYLTIKNKRSLCNKICEIFSEYKNINSYGGSSRYIKIKTTNEQYYVYPINPYIFTRKI